MELDVVLLSRIQFAFTVMFHYLFPPLTIGLAVLIVIFESIWMWKRDPFWLNLTKFWVILFAVSFAMGVASGIVLEFEFGTNWATYSRFVGDVFGSALAAEGIFAFFLESGFLAVLVFGWNRVGPKVHYFSTWMVCLGAIFSSIWIVVANSWQQTPAGSEVRQVVRDGEPWYVEGEPVMRAEIVNFWEMVFNPSSIDRILHVWIGALILGSFFVMSICAWYILRNRHMLFATRSFRIALVTGTIGVLAAPLSGHSSVMVVAQEQPAKLAALEGHYETGDGGSSYALLGIPNDREQRLDLAVRVPKLLSLLVYMDPDRPVAGLDRFPPEDRPRTLIPFVSFRLMVASGLFMLGLCLYALWQWRRGRLFTRRKMLWLFVIAVLPAYVANHAGWVAAETGRQPWIVYPAYEPVHAARQDASVFLDYATADFSSPRDGLRVADAVSRAVTAEMVVASMVMFVLIYGLLFMVWIYVLDRKIRTGPTGVGDPDEPSPPAAPPTGGDEGEGPAGGFYAPSADLHGGGRSYTDAHEAVEEGGGGDERPNGGAANKPSARPTDAREESGS